MRRLFVFLSVLLMFFRGAHALAEEGEGFGRLDSLRLLVEEPELSDSLRMEAMRELGWALRNKDMRNALEYTLSALDCARSLPYKDAEARLLANVGHLYWRLGNYRDSFTYLLESREIYRSLGDQTGYARTLNHLGILFSGQGFYDNALEYYLMALSIYEELDSVSNQASVLNNIGIVYENVGDFALSEEYHYRAMQISRSLDNEEGLAYSLHNLGSVRMEQGDFAGALTYYQAALDIRENYPDSRQLAYTKRNIGYLNYKQGQYLQALDLLLNTRELYRELGDDRGLAWIDHDLGLVYKAMNRFHEAHESFHGSLQLAGYIGVLPTMSDNHLSLADLYASQGDYASAYYHQARYQGIRDSIDDEASRRRVIELQLLYDRERKENEIELLRKANEIKELNLEKQTLLRNFLVLVVAFFLAMLLFVFFRYRESQKKNTLLRKQKDEISQYNNELLEQKEMVEDLNARLKQSEKHLLQANKTKDKFLSIISHDLRSPFASIVSFSRILKRDIDHLTKEELQELVRQLDLSVIRINGLLENLLQWSRTQSGKINYVPEYFAIKDVSRDALEIFAGTAMAKDITLVEDVSEKLIVWGDMNMTHSILRNLLSNALKYTNPGGRVQLSAEVRERMAVVRVSDNGVGISEQDLKKLFRVDRLHSTFGTNDEKGSGLGLILCREFCRAHDGDLQIESSPGKGTSISFTIPLVPPE